MEAYCVNCEYWEGVDFQRKYCALKELFTHTNAGHKCDEEDRKGRLRFVSRAAFREHKCAECKKWKTQKCSNHDSRLSGSANACRYFEPLMTDN